MATIKFETGETVNFQGDPTPADIEEVAKSLKLKKPKIVGGQFNTPANRKNVVATKQGEFEQAKKQADYDSSTVGMIGNTLKGIGSTLASSEVNLGNTIGKTASILGGGSTIDNTNHTMNQQHELQMNLIKLMRAKRERGEDVSKEERMFNELEVERAKSSEQLNEESNLPTQNQTLGQIGGVALDLATAGVYGKAASGTGNIASKAATATGLSELAPVATQQAAGLFTKQGAMNVAKGAGIGYASDVTQGLQGNRGESRTDESAFIPGLGTALGAGISAAASGAQSVKNWRDPAYQQQKLIAKRKNALDSLDSYGNLKKAIDKGNTRKIDIKKVLAEEDVLSGAVDDTGRITTKGEDGAVAQYTQKYIKGNEDLVGEILKKEASSISPELVRKKLNKAVMDAGIEGSALTSARKKIQEELDGYGLRAGHSGVIPVSTLHDAKVDKYNSINFFTEGNTAKYDKTVARALKELVEEHTKSVKIRELNNELSKHFAVIDYLEKLDGKRVEGGKLGKYFAQTVGAVVGSKLGPIGAIGGAEIAGRVKGAQMASTFKGKTGMSQEVSDVIKNAKDVLSAPPKALK